MDGYQFAAKANSAELRYKAFAVIKKSVTCVFCLSLLNQMYETEQLQTMQRITLKHLLTVLAISFDIRVSGFLIKMLLLT